MAASNVVEIIENKLYWSSDRAPPRNIPNAYFFQIDNDLVYEPFTADFGPLNLGQTFKFCTELKKLVDNEQYSTYRVYHYTSLDQAKRANAAFLMGAFQVMILGRSADEAWRRFQSVRPPFVDFRDASFGPCSYKCTILHCLRGLQFGIQLGWFDYRTFNLKDYEHFEKVENGDLNWIVPGKFVAFSGPSSTPYDAEGWRTFTPEDYAPVFKSLGVNLVVRLNKKQYDAARFTKQGIRHLDLYFLDGSVPSEEIILKFIDACEREQGAIAVHCKAGLGRTGTLIACYVMKHFGFPAADFIGWIRVSRPGSILGPQQQFLIEMQAKCAAWGRQLYGTLPDLGALSLEAQEMTEEEAKIATAGDLGQGERLTGAKRKAAK